MAENSPMVFVVDDDSSVRESLRLLLRSAGYSIKTFVSAIEFLESERPHIGSLVPCFGCKNAGHRRP